MTYQKQEMIRYPKWLKKDCKGCSYYWLEIWAFVWFENKIECSSPIGVCPKCGEIEDLEDFNFKRHKEQR